MTGPKQYDPETGFMPKGEEVCGCDHELKVHDGQYGECSSCECTEVTDPKLYVKDIGQVMFDPLSIDSFPCPDCKGACDVRLAGGPSGVHYWHCQSCDKYWRPGQRYLEEAGATLCQALRDERRFGAEGRSLGFGGLFD